MKTALVGRLALAAVLAPAPLLATFHEMKIVQVFGGAAAAPNAQYIMLQMYAPGQNLVGGHSLTLYNADGTLAATETFPAPPGGNLPNGDNQDTVLIGTAEAATFFGVSMDLTIPLLATSGHGAKICWAGDGSLGTPDCVAIGDYTGSAGNGLAGVGTPFPHRNLFGLALTRRLDICTGVGTSPTALDGCDDTDNSATDFVLTLPTPKNNARETGTIPAATCGNHVIEGLEDCDDGNATDGDGCSSKCRIEPGNVAPLLERVDHAATASSDGDTVLEPGETVSVGPAWQNTSLNPLPLTGGADGFTGPAGATYEIVVGAANYGTLAPGTSNDCSIAGYCYQFKLSAPASRPATHWDATFDEFLSGPSGTSGHKTWTLHVGDSFTDVPRSQPFYKRIESLLHGGITAGCTATTYCPGDPVSRAQMAIFIAKGIAKVPSNIPVSGTVNGAPYSCTVGGTSLFTDVPPEIFYCKQVHYIAAQNVTLGCGASMYCPFGEVSRLEMASFIAKAIVAPGGGASVPKTYGPDPDTGFSYSCDSGSPSIHFTDVPATDVFCKHVHYLWAKGIISGCSATEYCPTQTVTRDAMAKFLTNAFNLILYGP